MKIDLTYILKDRDRHGTERIYVRRNGRKITDQGNTEHPRLHAGLSGRA